MGGADAVLKKAKESYDKGEYRWVAQVVHHVVFADPNNKAARELEADALEQLGYQAESGPWRNFYLSGAQELRNGVAKLPTPNTASPDTVKAMTMEMVLDYWSVRLNREKAGNATAKLNLDLGGKESYYVELENGVINHTVGKKAKDADASISLSKGTLTDIMLKKTTMDDAIKSGAVKISGSEAKLKELLSYFDNFEFWFNIVTP
jgi:alkyl sulfatase BDS1-like metallo-beta-lactamase superfamily hydrolase